MQISDGCNDLEASRKDARITERFARVSTSLSGETRFRGTGCGGRQQMAQPSTSPQISINSFAADRMDGDNLDTLTREIDTTQINGQINFTYLVIGILLEL